MRRTVTLALSMLLLASCATTTRSSSSPNTGSTVGSAGTATPRPASTDPMATSSPTALAAGSAMPRELHWFRDSAERTALYLQTYAAASRQMAVAAAGLVPGTWAVILDADETVIDNSEYQKELWQAGKTAYDDALWTEWVARQAAPPLPGAVAFLNKVHALGGKIAIVTNRSLPSCDATRADFAKHALPFDVMLCKEQDGDKNPRFQAVERGGPATGMGPLTVVLWVGDNIRDFPTLDQSARSEPGRLGSFGLRFFLLPNPMYGSWEGNPNE